MSGSGAFPNTEDLIGPRPSGSSAAPAMASSIPSTEELIGSKDSAPPGPQQASGGFWKGAADLGAATWADFSRKGTPDGSSTPALDAYFDRTPAGQVLKSFGQDAAAPFHALSELTNTDNGEGLSFIKKAGVYKDWEANHAASAAYFRNAFLRPAAQDAATGPIGQGASGISLARGVAAGVHEVTQFPGQIGYGAGVSGAFDQLRKDIIDEPDDLSGLKGHTWEAKVIPTVHNFLRNMGYEGELATEVVDTGMLAFSLTGIPQLIGKTNEELSKAVVHAMPGRTPEEDQKNIQKLTDQLGFYENFVGPTEGGLAERVPYQANLDRRLKAARDAGVIGHPMNFDDAATGLKQAQARDEAQLKTANVPPPPERPPGTPSPALEPSEAPAAARAQAATPPPDIHATAREIAPETFTAYDPLLARHRWYTDWVSELREARDNDPRLAAAQQEIDGILAKVNGVEDRLTNTKRQQIEDIRGGMQDFLATDTPDMVRVKQELAKNYQQLNELTPAVRQAYAQAADQLARHAQETGVESTAQVVHPAPEPVTAMPIAPTEPPIAPGMVRMYHGGVNFERGHPLWFTSHYPKALGYAEKSNGGRVHYVDLPENHPLIAPDYEDQSVARGFTVERELPVELADQRKVFGAEIPATPPELPIETGHIWTPSDVALDVSRQLQAAGRPKEEADAQGALIASHYEARAARFGGARGSPADLYRAEDPVLRVASSRLMRDADPSTFMHETARAWLNEMMQDATHEAAPAELQRDAATVRQWLGAAGDEALTRRQQGKWARGFERYLMEGIAPTQRLAGVFSKFKQWLVKIYQTAGQLRAPINDEIRGVMDRLVAAPEGPTIITNPRSTAHMMADVHEVEAATARPEHAGIAADHIDREVTNQLRRVAPEKHDALLKSEGAGGPLPIARTPARSRATRPQPVEGPAGGDQAPNAFPAGGDQVASAGADVRTGTGEGGGPATGEHGVGEQASNGPGADVEPGQPAGERNVGSAGSGGLEFIQGTGEPVVSEFARNVEARAIAAGMPEDFFGDLPEHGVMSKADQSLRAVDLLHNDPEKAWRVAMVDEDPPHGLMRPFVVKAIENRARAEGDWETLRKLATNQKLADERTTIGRQLGAMAEQDPSDPAAAMRAVQKARIAKTARGTGKTIIKDMKTEMKKAVSGKDAWQNLIDTWTCK